jgi:hypothetical protein
MAQSTLKTIMYEHTKTILNDVVSDIMFKLQHMYHDDIQNDMSFVNDKEMSYDALLQKYCFEIYALLGSYQTKFILVWGNTYDKVQSKATCYSEKDMNDVYFDILYDSFEISYDMREFYKNIKSCTDGSLRAKQRTCHILLDMKMMYTKLYGKQNISVHG